MFSKERQAKVRKLDAILSKITGSTTPAAQSCSELEGGQDEVFEMIPEDQIKIEVLDDDDDDEESSGAYIRPTRLISRTGLEHFPCTSDEQGGYQSTVVILNSDPEFIGHLSNVQMDFGILDDGTPMYDESVSNDRDEDFYGEDGVYESFDVHNTNSIEARRTVLDSYLYHENDQTDLLDSAASYGYGIRAKDSFVVVHPSESVGIVCSICNKTFSTKKSLKKHCKYIHKTSARPRSTGKSQQSIGDANGSNARGVSNTKTGIGYSNGKSQPRVPVEKECKQSDALRLTEQKIRMNSLSKGIKAKTAKNELKTGMKKKQMKLDKMKSGAGMIHGKISLKGTKENERAKSSSTVNKKSTEKNKKVLTGKKVATGTSKSSISNSKFTKKPMKTEKVVKEDKKRSGDFKNLDIESDKGKIGPTSKKITESKKVTLKDKNQKEMSESWKKEKSAMNVGIKGAIGLEKRNNKHENRAKNKLPSKSPLIKKDADEAMPFKCDECGEGFRNMFNLRKHLPIHSIIKYHCYRCEDVFMNMRSLTKHLLIHEDEAPVVDHLHRCRICSQGFKTSRMLRGHLLEHERVESLEGSVSSSSKPKSKSFDSKHIAIKVNQKIERSHSSSLCVHNQDSKGTTMSDDTNEPQSTCQNLDKDVVVVKNSENAPEKDLSTSKEFNPIKQDSLLCTSCQLSFEGFEELKGHVIEAHINLGDMSLQCQKCSEVFTSEAGVISHLVKDHELSFRDARVVVGQKEHEAVLCGSRGKVSATSQLVNCDSSSFVDKQSDSSDPTVCLVRVDDDCSFNLCKENTGLEDKSALLANERQQFVEIEKSLSVENRHGNEGDLHMVHCEGVETKYNSRYFQGARNLNTEKGEDDCIQDHTIDTDKTTGVHESLMLGDTNCIETYDGSCNDLESPATEKSCVLEEQESRDILQALFIEVEEESPCVVGQDISQGNQVPPVDNCANKNESKIDQTRVNDAELGAATRKQCKGKGKVIADSSIVETNIFAPFVRRKASICGERRILEAISPGRKKVDNLPKKKNCPVNELSCNYDLHNGPETDNTFGVESKEQRKTLPPVADGNYAGNPVRGRKRKPLVDSEPSRPNEQQTWNGALGQASGTKNARHSKRRKRCWMFGKINRSTKRNRTVCKEAQKSGEKVILKQASNISSVLWDECHDVCQKPKTDADKIPYIKPEEAIGSNGKAYKTRDHCSLSGKFVESRVSEEQESTTQNVHCTIDESINPQSKEEKLKPCDTELNECKEEPLKETCQSDATGQAHVSDKVETPGCNLTGTEVSSLASLIYIPRRAAVAGQGKMQRANKNRNIGCPKDEGIGKPVSRKADVDVVCSKSNSLATEGRNSQKRRRKSYFTNVKRKRNSKAENNFTNLYVDDELSGSENAESFTSCSSFSCLNVEGRGQVSEASLILSDEKNNLVKWNEPSDDNRKLTCNSCGKRFNTMYFLRLHEKRHGGNGQDSKKTRTSRGNRAVVFQCKFCSLNLSSKVALANHLNACRYSRKQPGTSSSNVNKKSYNVQLPKSKQKHTSK